MEKEFASFISLITFLSPSCLTFCLLVLCLVVLVCAACHRALPGSFDTFTTPQGYWNPEPWSENWEDRPKCYRDVPVTTSKSSTLPFSIPWHSDSTGSRERKSDTYLLQWTPSSTYRITTTFHQHLPMTMGLSQYVQSLISDSDSENSDAANEMPSDEPENLQLSSPTPATLPVLTNIRLIPLGGAQYPK